MQGGQGITFNDIFEIFPNFHDSLNSQPQRSRWHPPWSPRNLQSTYGLGRPYRALYHCKCLLLAPISLSLQHPLTSHPASPKCGLILPAYHSKYCNPSVKWKVAVEDIAYHTLICACCESPSISLGLKILSLPALVRISYCSWIPNTLLSSKIRPIIRLYVENSEDLTVRFHLCISRLFKRYIAVYCSTLLSTTNHIPIPNHLHVNHGLWCYCPGFG